jgi:hypothetical protein
MYIQKAIVGGSIGPFLAKHFKEITGSGACSNVVQDRTRYTAFKRKQALMLWMLKRLLVTSFTVQLK